MIYPLLTVCEHLQFFGAIKGLSGRILCERIDSVIEDVGLTEKRNFVAKNLSGGQKRKLCLAMALIGDPKFILLVCAYLQ